MTYNKEIHIHTQKLANEEMNKLDQQGLYLAWHDLNLQLELQWGIAVNAREKGSKQIFLNTVRKKQMP